MQVTQKLNISSKSFYKKILESIQYDIAEQTGQTIPESDLVGFKYDKNIGKNIFMSIEILALETEKKYRFVTKTDKNVFDTTYEIETSGGDSCVVRYKETVESKGTIQKMNDMLVSIIINPFKKKRIKNLMQGIEASLAHENQE